MGNEISRTSQTTFRKFATTAGENPEFSVSTISTKVTPATPYSDHVFLLTEMKLCPFEASDVTDTYCLEIVLLFNVFSLFVCFLTLNFDVLRHLIYICGILIEHRQYLAFHFNLRMYVLLSFSKHFIIH